MEYTQAQQGAKGLKLTDILVTIVIAVVFGVIYRLWGPMYDVLKPLGLHAEQFSYGMWFIAGTFAMLVIRKPGVALLAELAAASVEALMGGAWGASTFVYGFFQGLGAEIFFMMFLYRRYTLGVTAMAATGAAAASLVIDQLYGYIDKYSFWNYSLFIGFRLIGSILIAGFFAYFVARAVERTGVTNLIRPVSRKDYEALE